ncbi:MAG: tRNA-dihydrouridine synthase [Lawsonibacter sp.]|jgi:tRNA-dihydrouridine synthase
MTEKRDQTSVEYFFAPMEGVTGALYRRAHHHFFPQVDAYYMPFLSPTGDRVFTPRDLRNVLPEHNQGFRGVPQLLTKRAEDFNWAADALFEMGYDEVNLNLGCPSGTVTAKGKGAGMLADPEGLDRFLEEIFAHQNGRGRISIKTRLGMDTPEEFPRLLECFSRYPVALLIIHPRVRQDFYRHPVRLESFREALRGYHGPVCYNGGLVTRAGCAQFQAEFPQVRKLMLGQGLLANPVLIRQMKGGPGPERGELRAFHDMLLEGYLDAFSSAKNTVYHMKELWNYLSRLFEGAEKPLKQIRKAEQLAAYQSGVEAMFRLPLREDALWP